MLADVAHLVLIPLVDDLHPNAHPAQAEGDQAEEGMQHNVVVEQQGLAHAHQSGDDAVEGVVGTAQHLQLETLACHLHCDVDDEDVGNNDADVVEQPIRHLGECESLHNVIGGIGCDLELASVLQLLRRSPIYTVHQLPACCKLFLCLLYIHIYLYISGVYITSSLTSSWSI